MTIVSTSPRVTIVSASPRVTRVSASPRVTRVTNIKIITVSTRLTPITIIGRKTILVIILSEVISVNGYALRADIRHPNNLVKILLATANPYTKRVIIWILGCSQDRCVRKC